MNEQRPEPEESNPTKLRIGSTQSGFAAGAFGSDSRTDRPVEAIGPDWAVSRDLATGVPMLIIGNLASGRSGKGKAANSMTGAETEADTGLAQRIEAAARALANEAAPESLREHWGTQPQWLKEKFRRRAALALAAADAVDVLRAAPAPVPVQGILDLGPGTAQTEEQSPAPDRATGSQGAVAPKGGNCDGYCRGSVCSYCGCCLHTADPSRCRTSSAPAGMQCPESGCGCEGTAA